MSDSVLSEFQFSSALHSATDVMLEKRDSLQVLGRETEVIVYSFGTRGADLARRLRNIGVHCLVYDNSKLAVERAAAEGFATTSNTDLDRPLIVAAGQNQISILNSLKRPAWSLVEGLCAFDLVNQYANARLFSSRVIELVDPLYKVYKSLDSDCQLDFLNVLLYRASLSVSYIADSRLPIEQMWKPPAAVNGIRSFCDVGAYQGETLLAMKTTFPELTKTFAIEPNADLIQEIESVASLLGLDNKCYAGAAWSHTTRLTVSTNPNGMMSISEDASGDVPADALDRLAPAEVFDYVKFDVESAEERALQGASSMLSNARCIAVAGYHLPDDLVDLPRQLETILDTQKRPEWRCAFRHYSECFDDSIFYFYRG